MNTSLWFKRKTYGWGWTPMTWQGWVVTLVYVGLLLLFAAMIDESSSRKEILLGFFLPALILTTALIRICYKKGETPRWQWGREEKE